MKQYVVSLNEDLSNWVRSKKQFPDYTSYSGVIRDCIKDYKEREEGKRREAVDLKRAFQSMTDEEIRAYVKRARKPHLHGTTAIKLRAEDAERVIAELDQARTQRDLFNARFQAEWLENMRLKREIRELEESVKTWRRRYMSAANPENVEIGG